MYTTPTYESYSFFTLLIQIGFNVFAQGKELDATLAVLKNETRVFKVTERGVIGDGENLNPEQFQEAIDQCHIYAEDAQNIQFWRLGVIDALSSFSLVSCPLGEPIFAKLEMSPSTR